MTIFGKILLGLILATAAGLIIKGAVQKDDVVLAPEEEAVTETETPAPADSSKFEGSTAELIARGGDHVCTFDQTVENNRSTGTVYISNGKMRGDFKSSVVTGATPIDVESHMISDGEFMYTWSSMMPTGFKMAVVQNTTADGTTPTSQQMFDANMKLSYDCDPWTVDASKFTLPSAVTFTEIKI